MRNFDTMTNLKILITTLSNHFFRIALHWFRFIRTRFLHLFGENVSFGIIDKIDIISIANDLTQCLNQTLCQIIANNHFECSEALNNLNSPITYSSIDLPTNKYAWESHNLEICKNGQFDQDLCRRFCRFEFSKFQNI